MLHPLKAKIDCEVSPTSEAPELLDTTVICVTNTISLDLGRSAVEASVNINRLDNRNLRLNDRSEFEAELNSPNVLTLDLAVDVVWATATPTTARLCDRVESMP
jgi:hypothetical protein